MLPKGPDLFNINKKNFKRNRKGNNKAINLPERKLVENDTI